MVDIKGRKSTIVKSSGIPEDPRLEMPNGILHELLLDSRLELEDESLASLHRNWQLLS